MKRFTILNLLLLTAVLALAICLVFENRNRTITICDAGVSWTVPEYLAPRSTWKTGAAMPPLSMDEVTELANSFRAYLNSQSEDTGYSNWQTVAFSLRQVMDTEYPNFWVYTVTFHSPDAQFADVQGLKIAILMDGSILFDPKLYPYILATTIREYPDLLYAPEEHTYPIEDTE